MEKCVCVNFKARKNESTVKTKTKSITVSNKKTETNKPSNFPIQEVKEVKKVNKYIIPTAILTGLALTYAEPTFAQTLGATSADPYTLADLAKMFVKGGMILDMFALGTSLLSMPVAGIVGVFNSDLSHDMIQKAMKAIGVTLYFPMVVISLAYLAHLLLGWWDMYLDVWVIFAPCIKPAILEVISQFKP